MCAPACVPVVRVLEGEQGERVSHYARIRASRWLNAPNTLHIHPHALHSFSSLLPQPTVIVPFFGDQFFWYGNEFFLLWFGGFLIVCLPVLRVCGRKQGQCCAFARLLQQISLGLSGLDLGFYVTPRFCDQISRFFMSIRRSGGLRTNFNVRFFHSR